MSLVISFAITTKLLLFTLIVICLFHFWKHVFYPLQESIVVVVIVIVIVIVVEPGVLPGQVEVVFRRYHQFVDEGLARKDSRRGLDCSIVVVDLISDRLALVHSIVVVDLIVV